jgi:hypothetical protein
VSAKVKVGDKLTHTELRITLTVQTVGRMVYMTSPRGLPYAIEANELQEQIDNGEWLVGKEKQQ